MKNCVQEVQNSCYGYELYKFIIYFYRIQNYIFGTQIFL
jgi:hypothetical protein